MTYNEAAAGATVDPSCGERPMLYTLDSTSGRNEFALRWQSWIFRLSVPSVICCQRVWNPGTYVAACHGVSPSSLGYGCFVPLEPWMDKQGGRLIDLGFGVRDGLRA